MATRKEIIEEARSYRGVPWRHQGRSRQNGIDCVGLIVLVLERFYSFENKEYKVVNYPRRPDGSFVAYFKRYLKIKPLSQAKDGDILIFATGKHPCHVGIRTTFWNQPGVIHAHAGMKKVIEQTVESAKDIVGKPIYCFEIPDIES